MPLIERQAQPGFQYFELPALKPGSWPQEVAKVEEIHGRHGFHDIHLLNQGAHDGIDPLQPVHDRLQCRRVIIDSRLL